MHGNDGLNHSVVLAQSGVSVAPAYLDSLGAPGSEPT
jgi:hypothetical protein